MLKINKIIKPKYVLAVKKGWLIAARILVSYLIASLLLYGLAFLYDNVIDLGFGVVMIPALVSAVASILFVPIFIFLKRFQSAKFNFLINTVAAIFFAVILYIYWLHLYDTIFYKFEPGYQEELARQELSSKNHE